MQKSSANLVWIDLEMTGLDTNLDQILEIATIVTSQDLNESVEGPDLVIYQPREILDGMDDWNQSHHGQSGLIAASQNSLWDCVQAERETLRFLIKYVPSGVSPMCGNSVCQDRRFLARCMPDLEGFFHYRNLDVSSVAELVRRWVPDKILKKQSPHRALDDVRNSVLELQHYKKCFFYEADKESVLPRN